MSVDPKSVYYDAGGIETIEFIKAKLTPEQFKGFLLGQIMRYSGRLNFKGVAARDAEKIAVYSELLKTHYSEETPTTSKRHEQTIPDHSGIQWPFNSPFLRSPDGAECAQCFSGDLGYTDKL